MYNWNQFRNFPKFKDMSAQEQARQYFLYQSNIMMEQSAAAIAPAAAAAAAAAGAGAGGGGGGGTLPKENFGQYRTLKAIYFDTMGGDNAPTSEELLGYDAEQEDDKQSNYRGARDSYNYNIQGYLLRQYEQPSNGDTKPEPTYHSDYGTYSTGPIFYKGALKAINQTWWASTLEVDRDGDLTPQPGSDLDRVYETWSTPENLFIYWTNPQSGLSASSIWPGVSEIKVLPAVASSGDLPLTGNPGEIIGLSASSVTTWYAWDPIEEEFSESVFNNYIGAFWSYRNAKRDANIKAQNEILFAISPFLWAANYVPSYWVRKELYDSQPGNYPG